MRAVAYCRVSTNDLDQLNSLHNQVAHYQDLFSKKGYTPVKVGVLYKKNGEKIPLEGIFADEGISGTKIKHRKAFKYMLRCAEDKEFDIVICKNVQRFSRNIADGHNALKRLKQLGINVYFEDGGLNYFEHEDIINLFLSMAQSESRIKSSACKFGIRKAQLDGKWTSNCPYGYNRVNGYLKINESEAEVVRKIYDLYLNEGLGHKKIVDYLTENKIPTKKNGIWHTQHVKHILTNPLYTGIQITHKSENMDINVRNIKEIPEDDWIIHKKPELQIISKDIWERAQDLAKKKLDMMMKNNVRPSSTNLFSTIVYCGNCGGVLRRKRKRTKRREGNGQYKMIWLDTFEWVCQNNDMYGVKRCNCRNSVDEEILLKFVKDEIIRYRDIKEVHEILLEKYIQKNFSYDENKANEIESNILELKQDYDNRQRLNGKGIITDDELEEFAKGYRIKISELERELLKIKNVRADIEEAKRQYEDFIKYINNVDIDNLTNIDLKKIFYKIVIRTDNNMLNEDGSFKDEYETLKEYPYLWINKSKRTVKIMTAEMMFMDNQEMNLLFGF